MINMTPIFPGDTACPPLTWAGQAQGRSHDDMRNFYQQMFCWSGLELSGCGSRVGGHRVDSLDRERERGHHMMIRAERVRHTDTTLDTVSQQ